MHGAIGGSGLSASRALVTLAASDLVIETGTNSGGSALYYSYLLEAINPSAKARQDRRSALPSSAPCPPQRASGVQSQRQAEAAGCAEGASWLRRERQAGGGAGGDG